jgi:GT2 family glycosyltransferase
MDAHTEYAPDYVRQCVAVLQETKAENVGGPWVAKGKGLLGKAIAAAFQSPFGGGGARAHNPGYEGVVDTVYLGSWPREIFDRIGLFDEELVRNQDDEFNLRLTRGGGKIWQSPRIKSWYQPRESLWALFRQYMQYGYWKVRVIQKHKLPASIRHLIPGGFVAMLLLLPFLSFWWKEAAWAWVALMATYLVANLSASFLVARQKGWKLVPLLPMVYFIYHFGYGYGFLQGISDFVLLRRTPSSKFTVLTRRLNG